MKLHTFTRSALVAAAALATFGAFAQSYAARAEHDACLDKASDFYNQCIDREWGGCEGKRDRQFNACNERYNYRVQAESRGAQFDSTGRFQPTQIPQRQPYMLPGAR